MNDARRNHFRSLHQTGTFVMPNAWDAGSARILEALGFAAIATTSSGHALTLGLHDQEVRRDELVAHVTAVASAVRIPVSVDSEQLYPREPGGVVDTIDLLAEAGAAGVSVEDYDPVSGGIEAIDVAVERVGLAAEAAHRYGLTLTARAENALYGIDDAEDTLARLRAYRAAGADVLYAPRLLDATQIGRLAAEVGGPVNVLLMPGVPVPALAAAGVRRVSLGGALAFAAYGALERAAREVLATGTTAFAAGSLTADLRMAALGRLRA